MTIGYIGSYTKKNGKGIYRFELNELEGTIKNVETGYEIEASTYLTRNENFLYAITKEEEDCGIASFKIKNNGELELINKCLVSKNGTGCYIQVSKDGNYLFEAVYGAGIARLYKLNKNTGEIETLIEELEHDYPTGPHERQEDSHVHFLSETPDNKYVVAADLGTDRIVTYTYGENGFKEYAVSQFQEADGTRHITFNDNGKYAYVVHELSNYVSVTEYHDGEFKEIERHLTIPQDFKEETKLAAVRLSHDQKHLYVSNRGHDSIAIYELVDNGKSLKIVDIQTTRDVFPRDFNITPDDKYIVCAHQEGDSKVTVFERDDVTGKLTFIDDHESAPEGVCVLF
ncbi:lactonase family protein [Staphylococcus caprae]|uniref:6-phosphogluconolactonase n=1 Tax=Staphylococcus caprae TaxID=29380 RepID=A0ABN5W2M3_9STAP|nr:beta-propeller fold lactonase family protein [Staphylococcus caprae]BBD92081.1 hypothetical protein JMUB590_0985 [Staphylococcus caprae]BBD94585.1 hypothetical protein JMUB898_0979 [Staphylococcus caprae]